MRNMIGTSLLAAVLGLAVADPAPAQIVETAVVLPPGLGSTLRVVPVAERLFTREVRAIGSVDFNQDQTVQVFAPYQGRVLQALVRLGDVVQQGQPLFSIDSPDLLQAEQTLIAADAQLTLTARNLARTKELLPQRAATQRDLDQAIADQQSAEGALQVARDALRVFNKTPAEIDQVLRARRADPVLVIRSPVAGTVVARNLQPGLFVQAGATPAPYTVASLDKMWMQAFVPEAQLGLYRRGQEVEVRAAGYPDRPFRGRITVIGATVDPNTRRVMLRVEVQDPAHLLPAGMFADFVIRLGDPVKSPAVPVDGVTREGDGTMSVWVTADRQHYQRRSVRLGAQQEGWHQVLDGLQPGELVAAEQAIYLSNAQPQRPAAQQRAAR